MGREMSFGWFSSGRDEAARLLLRTVVEAIDAGRIKGHLSYVFTNRESDEDEEAALFHDLVGETGLEMISVSSDRFQPTLRRSDRLAWREEFDAAVSRALGGMDADYAVLAGYMLIVSARLCGQLPMVNLHPALPGGPKGTWQEVIWKLLAGDEVDTGVMMHLVTEVLDEGPPIAYCTFPIKGPEWSPLWSGFRKAAAGSKPAEYAERLGEDEPLFAKVRAEGVRRELPLIVATLEMLSKGRVKALDRRIFDAQGRPLPGGLDLTTEIEEMIS